MQRGVVVRWWGKTVSETAATREISCSNCGAPVRYVPGEAVLTCAYCGTSTMLAGHDRIVRVESHWVLPARLDREEVRRRVTDWMRRGWLKAADLAEKADFQRIEGLVLPFWVVRGRAQTFWAGMNRRTRTVGSGDNRRSETYWEPTSGDFSEEVGWSIYAREDTREFWGLEALNPGGKAVQADWGKFFLGFGMGSRESRQSDLLEGKEPFSLDKVQGLRVVNGQVTQERAEQNGRDQIIAHHRRLAEGKATRITDCDTTITVAGVDLVYVPLWHVDYTYRGRPYRTLVNGTSGEVITGEAPVGKWDKVVVLSMVMGVVALVFGLVAALAEMPALWIGTGAAAGLAALYALWTALFSRG